MEKKLEYGLGDLSFQSLEIPQNCPTDWVHLIAHQFYNHTDEPVDILMMGENLPYEVCYFPDLDKWLSRSMGKVGKFESTDYWADEPDPPIIKVQEFGNEHYGY